MNLKEFNQLWVGHNKTLLICAQESMDDDYLIEILDGLNFKESEIDSFNTIINRLVCAIDYELTPVPIEIFLKEELSQKEVIVFTTYKNYIIVFIDNYR